MFRGVFVTGTDTNVGKTVVSAALMVRYRAEAPLKYWKPVQTGIEHDAGARWVVEGAGGVLVPINERETMADLICALDLPVLIAARSTLGTINHTLMTIEVLRRRMLRVAGVVMVGEPNHENRLAIEKYGAAEVIAEMPRFDPLTPDALEGWARTSFDPGGVLFVGCLR